MANKEKQTNSKKVSFAAFKYPSKEKDYFVENVSMLISSGMGVIAALDIVLTELKSKYFKKAVQRIATQIENGSTMWKALERSGIFSNYLISLLKIGEESGRLADNLKIIAAQNEKDKVFKSKIKSAMMYPVFVLILAAVIGLAVAWFILPKLATIFSGLKIELPLITQILIDLGVYLSNQGAWLIPTAALVLVAIVYVLFFLPKTRFIGKSLLFSLPGIKKVIQQVEVARFGFVLGTLLEAGLSITVAFDSLEQATTFPIYKKFYQYMNKSLAEGKTFQQAFNGYKKSDRLVPASLQRMISSGQQSGNLSPILMKISQTMEAKVEITTKNLSVILEPVLLVIVWIGVVLVALAVILPIYSLVGNINEDRNTVSVVVPPPVPIVEIADYIEEKKADSIEIIDTTIETPEIITELEVLDNAVGYLNVRAEGRVSANLITKIEPGDLYEYTDMQDNWYQIILDDDSLGWVFGDYVKELAYDE